MKSAHKKAVLGKVIVYAILILIAAVMIIPFLWMLSASIKSDREVFQMNPFVWIPANPKWDNYVKIWTKIPFGRFVGNTVYLTLIVTFLQLLTSSFAAYSFAKLDFRHKNGLFLAYIATIAMPWQVSMSTMATTNQIVAMDDLLAEYAPDVLSGISEDDWRCSTVSGSIYGVPMNKDKAQGRGFEMVKSIADELGIDYSTPWTYEDLDANLRKVKEAYPDVIPWDSDGTQYAQMANGWITSHSNFVAIDGVCSGALWGGTKDDLYTITTPAYTDTDMMVEYAKLMKEWDNIGVWKTDVLNNTASSNRDDYRIGRVAAEQHHTQTWTDLCSATPSNTIYQDDPDAESGFFYFGEETGNVVALSITHGAMAVSAASKNPERALMVYDLLRNDEECYRLLCYGIEGVSYEINDEGLRTTPEGYNSDTDNINGMTNWWWGRNDDLEIRDATRNWDAIDKLYSEYDSLKIDYPYGQFVPEVDDIQSKIDNINEVYTNYTKQISYGKYQGTAEEIVAEMQSALKQAGIEEVTAALQEQFDALYK